MDKKSQSKVPIKSKSEGLAVPASNSPSRAPAVDSDPSDNDLLDESGADTSDDGNRHSGGSGSISGKDSDIGGSSGAKEENVSKDSGSLTSSKGSDSHSHSSGSTPSSQHEKSHFSLRKETHHDYLEAHAHHLPITDATDLHAVPNRSQAITFADTTREWELDDDGMDGEGENEMDETLAKYDHTFDKLKEIYNHTIGGLDHSEVMGVNVDPIKRLFVKLWAGIDDSHQNVLRLERKDHEISVELAAVMAKTKTLIKLAEEDAEVAARLRGKLESAWGLADVGDAEERKNAIKIFELREDVFMLNRNINAAVKTEGQATVVELSKLKGQFEVQRNAVASEVGRLRSDLTMIFEKRHELVELKTNLEEKFKLLTEEEAVYQEAIVREKNRKERLQKAIRETIRGSDQKAIELEELVENLNIAERRLTDVDRYVVEQRVVNDDAQHELEIENNKSIKFRQDYEIQAKLCEKLNTDLFKRQFDLKEKEDEVSVARNLVSRMNRQKQANLKKVEEYKLVIAEIEEEREKLKDKLAHLEKELELAQKKLGDNKRKIEALDRERVIVNRALEHAVTAADMQENQRATHEQAVRNLQADIAGYDKDIAYQQTIITHLEKERDNYSHEAMKLAHHVVVRLEEARKLDRTIYDYQKKLGKVETQLKKQQQVYDNAVYEKALTQRQLRDALTEAFENNIKLSHLGHEILALKFLVGEKDTIIHIEASRYERVLRETTFYAGEGKRLKDMAYDMQRMAEALISEQFVLKKTVAAIEGEMGKQSYYANTAQSRVQVFSRKEMFKEQELMQVWEEWRVLHSKIRIGGSHFRQLVTDIRKIRVLIFEAKKENVVKSHGKLRVRKLQHEISVLENIISKETCMCNSLRENMRHPINVHRWRVLECRDPIAYEMVIKANLLSKRLIDRNAVIRQQDEDLKYKQEIYCQIREALTKAPSLEVPENVSYYQHLVAAKKRHYQSLQYELRSSQLHTKYYEEELENVNAGLENLKERYFRKMEQMGDSYSYDYPEDDTEPNIKYPGEADSRISTMASKIEQQFGLAGFEDSSKITLLPPIN